MLNQLTEPLIPDRDSSLSFSYPQKEFSSLRFDYEIDNNFTSLCFNQDEGVGTLVTFDLEIEEKGGNIK